MEERKLGANAANTRNVKLSLILSNFSVTFSLTVRLGPLAALMSPPLRPWTATPLVGIGSESDTRSSRISRFRPGHILCVCISVPFTVTSYIQFSSHHIALAVIIYSDLNHAQPKSYGGRPRAGPRSTLLGGLLLWGSGRGPNFKACSHIETQQLQAAKTSAVEYLSFGSNS